MFIYVSQNEGDGNWIYTVGHYDPDGIWQPESDHATRTEAGRRCAELNGEGSGLCGRIAELERERDEERRRFDFIGDHCSVTWQGAELNQIGRGAPTLREAVDKHLRRIDAARGETEEK